MYAGLSFGVIEKKRLFFFLFHNAPINSTGTMDKYFSSHFNSTFFYFFRVSRFCRVKLLN